MATTNKDNLITSANIYKYLFLNFLPLVGTTTFFAPAERMKIVLQTMKLMSINEHEKVFKLYQLSRSKHQLITSIEIVSEQGFFSLWRGNSANIYRLLISSLGNILIYQQLGLKILKDNKYLASLVSSTISILLSYPFDLCKTRMCSDMTRYGNKRIYSSVPDLVSKIMHEDSNTS
jgi:hypothetical protein